MIKDKLLEKHEWKGGIAIKNWKDQQANHEDLDNRGVYIVVRLNQEPPSFLTTNPAPELKGRKHKETPDMLANFWVLDSPIVYIGKAGGTGQKATLRTRLNAYVKHGFEKLKYSHWGGRLIWQVEGCEDFLIYWHSSDQQEPSAVESELLSRFTKIYGKKPFANLRR